MKAPPDLSPLEAHVGYWMRFVSNHVSHAFSLKLEAHGVTVAEWVVLRELLRLEETAPSELAGSLGVTRGAVSKLIERLVGKGLVSRVAGEGDRRFQSVGLTESGHALVPLLAALADENDAEFFGHLDAEQRDALLAMLRDVVQRHQLKGPPLA